MNLPDTILHRISDALINENNTPSQHAHHRPLQLLSHGSKSQIRNLIHKAAQDKEGDENITLAVTLSRPEARQLAQFLKRLSYNTVETHCCDRVNADTIIQITETIRTALADAGYAPR